MRFALLVTSHVLRLCGTLAVALGVGLFAFWVLDQSTFVESGSLLFGAVGATLAGGAALLGGRLLAQRRIGSEVTATPIITKPLE